MKRPRIDKSALMYGTAPAPIRDAKHLVFIRSLPCCVCGRKSRTVAHHLLRTGEHGMGRRSGDDKAIPMCDPEHRALHENGNELEWLAMHNIHGMALAASLWGCSGNVEQALDILAGLNDGD